MGNRKRENGKRNEEGNNKFGPFSTNFSVYLLKMTQTQWYPEVFISSQFQQQLPVILRS